MNEKSSKYHDFYEKGYVKLPFKLSEELVDAAVNEIGKNYNYGSADYNLNNRVENAWTFSRSVRQIASDQRILDFLAEIFHGEAFPFQTLNFEKGSEQKLHSDFYHFACSEYDKMVGVWVALENIDPTSGPLRVVPKSHKLPYLFPKDLNLKIGTKKNPYEYYKYYENCIEELVAREGMLSEVIVLQKGEILIWHSNLIHGGTPIEDPSKTRLSQVTHYYQKNRLYFTPIQSLKNLLFRRYRNPYNILTGQRIYHF